MAMEPHIAFPAFFLSHNMINSCSMFSERRTKTHGSRVLLPVGLGIWGRPSHPSGAMATRRLHHGLSHQVCGAALHLGENHARKAGRLSHGNPKKMKFKV